MSCLVSSVPVVVRSAAQTSNTDVSMKFTDCLFYLCSILTSTHYIFPTHLTLCNYNCLYGNHANSKARYKEGIVAN